MLALDQTFHTRLSLTQLDSAWLSLTQRNSVQLSATQNDSEWLNVTQPDSAGLSRTQRDSIAPKISIFLASIYLIRGDICSNTIWNFFLTIVQKTHDDMTFSSSFIAYVFVHQKAKYITEIVFLHSRSRYKFLIK